jgi:farnesyl-diphosphate farnesyltransferase
MKSELAGSLLASVSRSFYLSIKVLPAQLREPIALAYLLARASDSIADTAEASSEVRIAALGEFRAMIVTGRAIPLPAEIIPTHPGERLLLAKLQDCFEWLAQLPPADRADIVAVLEKITRGQELDVRRFGDPARVVALKTASELDEYTQLVAGCVGEFWTRVCVRHLARFARLAPEEMERLGASFGRGLQLVNILRDLPADLRSGRCYLPAEEIGEGSPEAMRASFARWVQRCEEQLDDGWRYIVSVRPWRIRYACFLPWRIAMLTVAMMKKSNPLDSDARLKVPRSKIRAVICEGLLAACSNRFLPRQTRR